MILNNLKKAKQKSYENQVGYFIDGAKKYLMVSPEKIDWKSSGKKYTATITLGDMVDEGLFKLPIKNPVTNEVFNPDTTMVIVYKEDDNKYTYQYSDSNNPVVITKEPGLYVTGTDTFAKITLDGVEVDATWENIKKVYPAAFSGTTIVSDGMSSYLKLLSGDLVISNEITTVGDHAFDNCNKLTSVIIPNSVTSMGEYAFYYCTALTNVTIPTSVKTIGNNAFYNCSSLKNLVIPSSVTTIGNSAFYRCWALESVTIDDSAATIGTNAFQGCTSLKTLSLGSNITTIGNNAFNGCSALTSVVIPNSVTTINAGAFQNCTGLTSATIGTGVTLINSSTFNGCTSLSSVTIPTSVKTINASAFYNCTALASLTIPTSVTKIGSNAFKNVPHIYYTGTATGTPWGAIARN